MRLSLKLALVDGTVMLTFDSSVNNWNLGYFGSGATMLAIDANELRTTAARGGGTMFLRKYLAAGTRKC